MSDDERDVGTERLALVSVDGHIGAPVAAYREYLDPVYRAAFDDWAAAHAAMTPERIARKMEKHLVHPPMRPYPDTAQICDPATRAGIMDDEGVAAEVLFPGPDFTDEHTVPFKVIIGANPYRVDLDLEVAGEKAYNRWLADYCREAAPRALGLFYPDRSDMDQCVKGLRWAKDEGFVGVHLTAADARLPAYWDEYWEPMWAACVDLGLPVVFHGGTGYPEDFRMWQGTPGATALMWTEAGFWATRPLKFLICGGVLERHPHLKVIITEVGNIWVPAYFAALDAQWDNLSGVLSMLPSEYWQRQCYLGASLLRRKEWPLRDQIGLDHMMYGVDFPHPEGSWQRTKVWLQTLFHGAATVDEVRAFVQDNALRIYELDPARFRPIADRVGFTAEELLEAPPDDLPPEIVNKGDLALA